MVHEMSGVKFLCQMFDWLNFVEFKNNDEFCFVWRRNWYGKFNWFDVIKLTTFDHKSNQHLIGNQKSNDEDVINIYDIIFLQIL